MKRNECPGCSFCKPHPPNRFIAREGSPGCLVLIALPLLWWLL